MELNIQMKKILLLLLLLIPLILAAQLNETVPASEDSLSVRFLPPMPGEEEESGTSMTGVLGSITLDGVTYSQIRLMPEFRLWKLRVGLDLDFLVDADGNVRGDDWDEWTDLFYKIYYLGYGDRSDPIYFKALNIDDYSLANGLIFDHYCNTLQYPAVRNTGGFAGINTNMMGFGLEGFTHNIVKNQILAARVSLKPMSRMPIPLFKNLSFGLNVGLDRDQHGKYEDKDGDKIPDVYDRFPNNSNAWADTDGDGVPDQTDIDIDGDNSLDDPVVNPYVDLVYPGIGGYGFDLDASIAADNLTAYDVPKRLMIYSMDYRLPLVDAEYFKLYNYGEIAKIDGYGSGYIFPGLGAKFSIFESRLEMRRFSERFLPSWFDHLYDDQRAQYYMVTDPDSGQDTYYLEAKESRLEEAKAAFGWYGSLSAKLMNIAKLVVEFQDMYGEGLSTGKSLSGWLSVYPSFLKNLEEASLVYSQKNVSYLSFTRLRNPGAIIGGKLSYRIAANASLIGRYSEHYTDINNDGLITLKEEVVSRLSFGVEFKF